MLYIYVYVYIYVYICMYILYINIHRARPFGLTLLISGSTLLVALVVPNTSVVFSLMGGATYVYIERYLYICIFICVDTNIDIDIDRQIDR